ncbi:hypothetical protein [Arachidicoccus soli]|uniref:Uncharacterized protein n=1 Tax=Arachidicoccus soli TaxID=2341117 RepID=A0A386HQN7_9BACT|nr:hypothetical protein [Arachidicoccus soli]AYD47810.1 hypothetical protein D6B99_09535 [Arachidicoccus soli]
MIRKKLWIKCLLLVCSITIVTQSFAQVFGGNPAKLKWQQINTDSFRIIFPEGLDATAKNVASLVQFQQRNIAHKSMGNKLRKVNIVLQNQMTYSNGYVGLGPYRSEFYLMPPLNVFNLGAQNWADNLAIHEYRHVEQYNNFDRGLSHFMKILFGDNGQALANSSAVPDWFFEGDAVYNETVLSKQGRGRLPLFMNAFKALYLDGKQYSYQKIRNGSFKDYVPDHYNLGYLLVAYGYQKYGADFWKNVTHDAAAFKGLVYPMQKAIKKYSGISFSKFKSKAFSYYQNQWQKDKRDSLVFITKKENRNVADYEFPYLTSEGALIALKSDYKHIAHFVKLKDGKEESIAIRPIANDNYFSYNNRNIVYSKLKPSARWSYKEYSDIELLNIDTKKKQAITHNERYFTPDISHNGKLIAAVKYTTQQHSSIVILTLDGNTVFHKDAEENHIFSYPKFKENDSSFYIIERNKAGEMAIQEFNLFSKKETNILPFGNRLLGFPVVQGDTLIFTCSNKGNDETWAYLASQKKVFNIAKAATGIYQAVFKNNALIGTVFTADGYRLATLTPQFTPVEILSQDTLERLYHLSPNKNYSTILSDLPSKNYAIGKYSKWHHPFNFHSLQPNIDDPNYTLTLYGENILNTLQTNLSYNYNRIEESSQLSGNIIYGGSFVEPFLGASYTFNRTAYSSKYKRYFHFKDMGWQAGLQLPLNFSSGNFYKSLTISSSFNQRFIHWEANNINLNDRAINYLSSGISFVNQTQEALQQIYPRFAQAFSLLYRNTVDANAARQILARADFYFPGLSPTHGFKISTAYQYQDTLNRYSFSYNFPFSRGYNLYNFQKMFKAGADYVFPIAYPDWGFGDMVYFKRLRADVFYDCTLGYQYQIKSQQFSSVGTEIDFDINLWNQLSTSFGIRYSRLLNNGDANKNRWEILLPINLFK